jgi:hypothetical protein
MPQFSIPNRSSNDRSGMRAFLSPRKNLIAVAVVCALSAAALWVGTPSPTVAAGADNPIQLRAHP